MLVLVVEIYSFDLLLSPRQPHNIKPCGDNDRELIFFSDEGKDRLSVE